LYRTVGRYFAVSVLIAGLNGLALLVAGLALVLPLTPPGTGVVCLLASLAHPPSGPADKIKALMTPGSPAGTSARRRMSTNPSAPTAAPWPARDFRMERA
jgi:hypothetical protein